MERDNRSIELGASSNGIIGTSNPLEEIGEAYTKASSALCEAFEALAKSGQRAFDMFAIMKNITPKQIENSDVTKAMKEFQNYQISLNEFAYRIYRQTHPWSVERFKFQLFHLAEQVRIWYYRKRGIYLEGPHNFK